MCSERINKSITQGAGQTLAQSVTNFSIEYHQYLNPAGELVISANDQQLPSILNNKQHLQKLYKAMVLARTFDNKAVALQRTGRMGTYPSALGQEAISLAMADCLEPNDVYVPYYRDISGMLLRGIKMEEILLYWGGDERGSDFSCKNKDLPICVPIATQCLHAAGVAAAFKYKKQTSVSITSIGEGGTSKGDFYEALNLAGTWQLPVVFVINNNQWAISVPREKQTHCTTIAQKGIAAGITSVQVDGNDITALQDIIKKAVDNARANNGPTIIEAITYRMGDHTTADDATRYRKQDEVENARKTDPIRRLYNYLLHKHFWDAELEQNLQQECAAAVETAVNNYLNMKPQPPEAMFDYLYAELPETYHWQRDLAKKLATELKHEEM